MDRILVTVNAFENFPVERKIQDRNNVLSV